MHGEKAAEPPDRPVLSPQGVVEFLRAVPAGKRPFRAGFALVEVMVAIALLGAGVLGVAAIGLGGQRMARIGAARTGQAITAVSVLEQAGRTSGSRISGVVVDTTRIGDRLLELRISARAREGAGEWSWVTRRLAAP
jgi:prepilin-type N-terminal cleavage/methylation domain-containing protein